MTTVPTPEGFPFDLAPEASEPATPFEVHDPGPAPDDVDISIDLMTPDLAGEILRANAQNRRKRQSHIRKLSGAMCRGEFVFNGDPVRICVHGDLLDGQHRLEAVIDSGQSVWMLVIRGLPCDVVHTIDTDMAARTLRDVLKIRQEAHSDLLAGAILWKWRKELNVLQTKENPTPAQALAVLDKHPGLRDTAALCHNSKPLGLTRMSPVVMAALMYEFGQVDQEDAVRFFKKFTLGTGLEENDPILLLRSYLQKVAGVDSTGRRKATPVEMYMTTVKAWNAWRGGERLRSIRWVGSKHTPVEPR